MADFRPASAQVGRRQPGELNRRHRPGRRSVGVDHRQARLPLSPLPLAQSLSLALRLGCRGAYWLKWATAGVAPPSPAPSLSFAVSHSLSAGLRREVLGTWTKQKQGLQPPLSILFPLFFCCLITHSSKTANPISQPPILTRSLNDLLLTIHSHLRQGSILITSKLILRLKT